LRLPVGRRNAFEIAGKQRPEARIGAERAPKTMPATLHDLERARVTRKRRIPSFAKGPPGAAPTRFWGGWGTHRHATHRAEHR